MDQQSLRGAVQELEHEIAEKRREIETLQQGLAALQLLLTQREQGGRREEPSTLIPPSAPDADDGPRGKEAIKTVLQEQPGRWVSIQDIADTLVRRGWIKSDDPVTAARTSADRVYKADKETYQRRNGDYRYMPEPDDDDEEQSAGDVVSLQQQEGGNAHAAMTELNT